MWTMRSWYSTSRLKTAQSFSYVWQYVMRMILLSCHFWSHRSVKLLQKVENLIVDEMAAWYGESYKPFWPNKFVWDCEWCVWKRFFPQHVRILYTKKMVQYCEGSWENICPTYTGLKIDSIPSNKLLVIFIAWLLQICLSNLTSIVSNSIFTNHVMVSKNTVWNNLKVEKIFCKWI